MRWALPAGWPWLVALALLSSRRPAQAHWPPPSAGRLSLAQLRQLAAQAGFPDPVTAAAVAMAESGGDPSAQNLSPRERSYGLWQVNVLAHSQYDPTSLRDPMYNARAAFAISSGGTDWSHWTAYTTSDPSRSYRRFMS